ncbi:Zn-dependent alcohol dehydrogenase [Leptospira biflexa serovar Patoc strain 'Patoc 1 (Ames)']|uniref:Putative L-threonine 3-dehydrogenase n=1 Tax=Leptospira biflexa serovar Patoc (strain Patoc 1 / ATCC 23582 / Paris) TaxID=456481 RepID=B0SPL3_LEPBP|nr:alcohol dehydrogenase catalytic domain-containing protein [Leptospira biflexa]ABZ95420.1 Zn-dependent alcohol dehydrogenase [Leptospira biflexa serovar Patoc strain 'Patoc 1 (Ames)']ABZ99119.1 Putative L-threonine 3-dehydrogenase [Leptospira biflexa serovar Patoc strain 'Patoc 1 (Paris)']
MLQLVFRKKGILDWEEVEPPTITGENQALVEPIAIARCDLDLPIVRGETLFRPPFPVGHEFVGRIKQISEDLEGKFKIGAIVALPFQISCGTCPTCLSHHSNSCETVPYTSAYGMPPGAHHVGGAITELIKVPFAKQMLFELDPNINPVGIASFSDNIAEAWKLAGRFLERKKDPKTLVVGGNAGSIGLYTALYLHQTKKAEVVYADTDKTRIELAASLGIPVNHYTTFPKPNSKYDLVCDASATKEGWEFATRSLGRNAILSSASIFWTNRLEIPYLEMYNQGAEIQIGRVESIDSMHALYPEIQSGVFTPEKIVTKTVSFAEAKEAWMEESIKLVVTR